MTRKIITFEFIVPTVVAAAIAVTLSIVAVYLIDKYLGREAHDSVAGSPLMNAKGK
jgi:hypothetical protein